MNDNPEDRMTEETTVSIVVRITPFLMQPGVPFRGNVQALAEQMTRYVGERMSERFTADHQGAGLFLATVVKRGDETGSFQYREGHFADADAPLARRLAEAEARDRAVLAAAITAALKHATPADVPHIREEIAREIVAASTEAAVCPLTPNAYGYVNGLIDAARIARGES